MGFGWTQRNNTPLQAISPKPGPHQVAGKKGRLAEQGGPYPLIKKNDA